MKNPRFRPITTIDEVDHWPGQARFGENKTPIDAHLALSVRSKLLGQVNVARYRLKDSSGIATADGGLEIRPHGVRKARIERWG